MSINQETNNQASLQNANGLCLLQFESLCYFYLTKHLIQLFQQKECLPIYGCEPGRNTYIAMGLQLDLAVYVYESTKHFSLIVPTEANVFKNLPQYSDLEVVRNNIHTFFKQGGFVKKATSITNDALAEYEMLVPDELYALRSDISLVFEIIGNTRQLSGSDSFIKHCIFETKRKWKGQDYKGFAEFLSASVKAIASTVDETPYRLSQLHFSEGTPEIELFDYKSPDLYAGSGLSLASAFRLMLMLDQISYGVMLTEKLIHGECMQDELWMCFFAKLLAIKYDETFDNLDSILRFADKADRSRIEQCLSEIGLEIHNLKVREFARKLRNTIHYQEIVFDNALLHGNTSRDYMVALYLSNAGVSDMVLFSKNYSEMREECKMIQTAIRRIMAVDKEYFV